mgnify:CR=1 FL=1
MYSQTIKKIVELGDTLPKISGAVIDIGKTKQHLTEKDIEIETELTNLVNTFSGEHSVYAEELHDNFIEKENVWIIDPISNTANFIHGMPHYSIVLSHMYKGSLLFAVVYDPSNKELFTAEAGKGAFLNGKRIHVSKNKTDLFCLINRSKKYMTEESIKIIGEISKNINATRDIGSLGIHYAYVACGRADVAISFNPDTFPEFAGKLLVEEAGGKFTDLLGGDLNAETVGIVASNGLIHDEVIGLIEGSTEKPHFRERVSVIS